MKAHLILKDGTSFEGEAAGYQYSAAGEVVFTTGMVGYEQSLTDPSYAGQILTFTYPLIGNWGVPSVSFWESEKIQVAGVIISDLCQKPNHHLMQKTLNSWLTEEKIPAIVGIDTRALTQKLRTKGVMLGKIVINNNDIDFDDPNSRNLVAEVSVDKVIVHNPSDSSPNTHNSSLKIGLLNCGAKRNIIRSLVERGVIVYELPHNFDPFSHGWQSWEGSRQRGPSSFENKTYKFSTHHLKKELGTTGGKKTTDRTRERIKIDGLVISNGPGNPKMAKASIDIVKKALKKKIPTFGICLGNQLLALAASGNTYKLKFGHRAQNQPTIQVDYPKRTRRIETNRCFITTQNHGYAVDERKLPEGFKRWFYNANDNTNEGLIHENLPFFSVQFHPEATPGPTDTDWLFDYFVDQFR